MTNAIRRAERGSALLLAMLLVLAIAVIGAGLLRLTGNDRIESASLGVRERAQACAEAGVQYGRRFFGLKYEDSNGWNAYLSGAQAGFRWDPAHFDGDATLDASDAAAEASGKSDGSHFDEGADADGDGRADFWVSIRDDDDERPLGATDDRARDNNEVVILRSVCTQPNLLVGEKRDQYVAVEVVLAHIQGSSGYGNAQITSNSPDIVGERP